MSMSHGYGPTDDEESARALLRALDLGYTMLDTAALYGFGKNARYDLTTQQEIGTEVFSAAVAA
jgi:aryl-alcohol dehydrogenase-like predicted oxidoreductase